MSLMYVSTRVAAAIQIFGCCVFILHIVCLSHTCTRLGYASETESRQQRIVPKEEKKDGFAETVKSKP